MLRKRKQRLESTHNTESESRLDMQSVFAAIREASLWKPSPHCQLPKSAPRQTQLYEQPGQRCVALILSQMHTLTDVLVSWQATAHSHAQR